MCNTLNEKIGYLVA